LATVPNPSVAFTSLRDAAVGNPPPLVEPATHADFHRATQVDAPIKSPAITVPSLHHASAVGAKGWFAPVLDASVARLATFDPFGPHRRRRVVRPS